jgi:hypothetical protein
MKTTKEMIAVMQAHCDGKQIEYTQNNEDNWVMVCEPSWNWKGSKYRVKPESQYQHQPFDFTDAERLIGKIVRSKDDNNFLGMITSVSMDSVAIGGVFLRHKGLLKDFLFLDGSICGKLK